MFAPSPHRRKPAVPASLGGRVAAGAERRGDLADRGLLLLADRRSVLLMAAGDAVHQAPDEAAVVLDLLGARLAFEQRDGVADGLESVLLELAEGVVARVVALRPRADDLVQQLAVAVLRTRLRIRLRHRERLARHPALIGGDDDHARVHRGLADEVPFLL